MKRTRKNKKIYDSAITYDNLYKMWNVIRKTCKNRREVFYFSLNLNTNLMNICNDLKNRKYVPGKYRTFMIFEPKPRLVMSQSIYDKIVNHFVANYYLIPLLEPSLINENVATRKGKGTAYANRLLKHYFNKIIINDKPKEIYALKIDINKYFYNIDHNILLSTLNRKIKDMDVINLINLIISETNKEYINNSIIKYNEKYKTDIPLYNEHKGLSIGAMSSQFLAIFYLNDLDHYIKEKLQCKYYIRYMDDFLILDIDKERLKAIWKEVKVYIQKINLCTNAKSNIYRGSVGFNFLGLNYQYYQEKIKISYNKKTYKKIVRKLSYLKSNDMFKYKKSIASYYGYFKNVKKIKNEDYKIKINELYNMYKEKYDNALVIIKDGVFYKTFFADAKILWYLIGYKYNNKCCSFNNILYDEVIDKLKTSNISFVIVSKIGELVKYFCNNSTYNYYVNLSKNFYEKLKI